MSGCQSYRIFLSTSQKLIVTKTNEFSSRGHCYVDLTVLQIVFGILSKGIKLIGI